VRDHPLPVNVCVCVGDVWCVCVCVCVWCVCGLCEGSVCVTTFWVVPLYVDSTRAHTFTQTDAHSHPQLL